MIPEPTEATPDGAPSPPIAPGLPSAGYRPVAQVASVAGNRTWWDAQARQYYDEHGAFLGDADLVWGPEGLTEGEADLLGVLAGKDVLEIGCGAGQGSRWAAAAGARSVATDLSAGMLTQARLIDAARTPAPGSAHPATPQVSRSGSDRTPLPPRRPAAYVQCDACALPFAPDSFDVAFSAYGAVPFVADSAGLMREVARVVRPGGRWVFSVTHPLRWAFPDVPGEAGLTVCRSYFDSTPYVESADGVVTYAEHHRTLSARVRELRQAGFTLLDLLEPEWPDGHDQTWGGWSPLRGRLIPGTVIFVATAPSRPAAGNVDLGPTSRDRIGPSADQRENGIVSSPLRSDLEIARAAELAPLDQIAAGAGISPDHLEPYGRHVAKIDDLAIPAMADRPRGKYVVVTAITPTPLGEGKTTTAVGLAQGFKHLGKQATLALRQPSMGPTFGIKGGAAGAGYSQVIPMETLNLHLTGDFHAITAAHNMLAAIMDNHLHHGNELRLDPRRISWRRVVDINDRSLRNVVLGLGARIDGVPRQSGFDITAASEVGVALALATSLHDLRRRLGRIVVGYTFEGEAVTAEDLKAAGAMTVIMREAIKPNLLQTIEHTPVLIHAGPFGNIATGNSSIIADLVGIRMGDYLITEAGFGSDMGAERFFNVKCRESGLQPDAAVLVVTVRALKTHSGRFEVIAGRPLPPAMLRENPDDVRAGADNLLKHLSILSDFGISPVVAINVFPDDHESEHEVIRDIAREAGARVATSTHVVDGGAGAIALAKAVAAACDDPHEFRYTYELDAPLMDKLTAVATKVYGADHVAYAPEAKKNLAEFERLGYGGMPVVIAKTHLSISHDPALRGAPTGWTLPVREVRLAAGAGYVYAICGEMRTMPGLSRSPAAERIDIDDDGQIVGLF